MNSKEAFMQWPRQGQQGLPTNVPVAEATTTKAATRKAEESPFRSVTNVHVKQRKVNENRMMVTHARELISQVGRLRHSFSQFSTPDFSAKSFGIGKGIK
jgi:hypothetical protein